jgi:hypothetical protein
MDRKRIEKAVEIINFAIKNHISVKEASVKCGCSDTYVKNTKALVYEQYGNNELNDEDFSLFDTAYKEYSYYRGFGIKDDEPVVKSHEETPIVKGEPRTTYNEKGSEAVVEWKSGSNYPLNHIKTLAELLSECDVDLTLWQVKEHWLNKWDVTSWKQDFPETIQNFQVKARLEKIPTVAKEKAIGEYFLRMIKDYSAPTLKVPTRGRADLDENNLFELSIFDLHMGKLAWGGETGENYDTKIARARFLNTVETLISRASAFNYSKILFPVGSDFFNSDTIYNTTTKGTPQDEDLRWQKTFNVGVRLLVDAINLLKQTGAPVDVVVIPGNHDFERSFYMGAYLEAWFNTDPMVKVNNGASPRKYYVFGKVMLGLTHGSEEKEGSLPMLMATDIESKPYWTDTTYHEWHVGHIHRKRDVKYNVTLDKTRVTNEDLGVTVRYLSSLTGTEEWHHKKGFVGAIKAGEAFVWNDQAGLLAHINANLTIE